MPRRQASPSQASDDEARERAELARAKDDLAGLIRRAVKGRFVDVTFFGEAPRRYSPAGAAARVLGTDRARVSKILNGRLDDFSVERLLLYLRRLGRPVTISVAPPGIRGSLRVARSGRRRA